MKRAFIIHGWQGNSGQGWYPWLGKKLTDLGFEVVLPDMPNTNDPQPEEWTAVLSKLVGTPDFETCLVGHSAGAQTIMRYLEQEHKQKVGCVVLVAPWPSLNPKDRKYGREMCERWMRREPDWGRIRNGAENITAIFSTNDPYVAVKDSDVFREKLGAKIIIEEKKRHMSELHGIFELQSALSAVEEIYKEK